MLKFKPIDICLSQRTCTARDFLVSLARPRATEGGVQHVFDDSLGRSIQVGSTWAGPELIRQDGKVTVLVSVLQKKKKKPQFFNQIKK